YTLTASAASLTGATSAAFSISSGAATKVVFQVQPSNVASGSPISPAVTVAIEDASGNVVSSTANVTIALGTNPSGGTLGGTLTVAAVSGVASFANLTLDKAGNGYTLAASAASLTGATSSAFNVSAGTATKLAFTVQPSNGTAAQP